MTATKDMSRPPSSQHRLSVGSNAAATLPVRTSYSRSHSHTISLGSVNASNRINRRKSSTFAPGANAAAIGAVLESAVTDGLANRRSSMSRNALGSLNDLGYPPMPSSLPQHVSLPEGSSESAVVDGPTLSSFHSAEKAKQRMRRASDGSRLTKKEKAASGDLKCEHCGKAYKHGSCLNKHLWEHTPQWQYTSKLLISKHQQVQLLEAASVLVAMNADGTPTPTTTPSTNATTTAPTMPAVTTNTNDSDNSSSPAASGSSERDDERDDDDDDDLIPSSAETTPPPHADPNNTHSYRDRSNSTTNKRYSTASSSAYSRSYQSHFSFSDAPNHHHRHWSSSSTTHPPAPQLFSASTFAESYPDEDPQELAAAVGLLSCSYGTPKSGPLMIAGDADDVPPVPPLPRKYVQGAGVFGAYGGQDVDMGGSEDEEGERRGAGEEFEGVFGRMDA